MGTLVDGCAICNGIGQVAAGAACPVCGGTGVATADQAAAYRQLLVDAAVDAATERFRQAGTHAAEGVLRGLAQARDDAKETTARAGEVLSALLEVRRTALEVQAAALEIRSHPAAALFVDPQAPDPTDPPPGITLPAGMGGELFYFDSLLVRQLDVWGNLNIGGSGGLMSNPMTTLGDLITGSTGGAPIRLGIGGTNQVLTVVGGVPAWANSPAGFSNPMTGTGDLITSTAGGTPVRLPAGTNGQALVIASGTPAWTSSVLVNPMTSLGDLITGAVGGAPQRIPAGPPGYVLTMASGLPAWQPSTSGFSNPMTTSGDLITATAGGSAIRLPVGSNNQVLTVVGGVPNWAANTASLGVPMGGPTAGQQVIFQQPDGSMVVLPLSTYGIAGGDDGHWINQAYAVLPTYVDPDMGTILTIGTVRLLPATYNVITGIVVPPQANLLGHVMGTMLQPVGAITAVFQHYGAIGGNNQNFAKAGSIMFLHIDGTNATGAAIGVDVGDSSGQQVEYVWIGNFDTTGAIGFNLQSKHFFTEKFSAKKIYVWNCETAVSMQGNAGDTSFEYNDCEFYMRVFGKGTGPNTGNDQTGLVIAGCGYNGSLRLRGNNIIPVSSLAPATGPVPAWITFTTANGNIGKFNGTLDTHTEYNGTGQSGYKIYYGDASSDIGDNGANGVIDFAGGTNAAAVNPGQFAFIGVMNGVDFYRRVTTPALTTPTTNNQCAAMVTFASSAGVVTVDNVPQSSGATGPFFLGWNRTISWTGTPSAWTWSNAT